MLQNDILYGNFEVVDKVIIELLDNPKLVRIAHIMQGATTAPINGWKDFSRLEHSIGVMLLIKHLGGSLDEQIAGLLHDFSHPVFSHVADYVFRRSETQDYHEIIKNKILSGSGIPEILEKHGFDPEVIFDDKKFSLLERKSPDICADRVDYLLRGLAHYLGREDLAKELFKHLIRKDNELIFDNYGSAVDFALIFLEFDVHIYTNLRNQTAYVILAEILNRAMDICCISEQDLFLTDEEVMLRLKCSDDSVIKKRLKLLTQSLIVITGTKERHDYSFRSKARVVDPKFSESGSVKRVSEVNKEYLEAINEHRKAMSEIKYVKVVGL